MIQQRSYRVLFASGAERCGPLIALSLGELWIEVKGNAAALRNRASLSDRLGQAKVYQARHALAVY